MPTLKAVIFDMDGTLIDSMPFHIRAWKQFLDSKGIKLTEEAFAKINQGTLYDIMPRLFGSTINESAIDALGEEKESVFREIYAPFIAPLPGLMEWLQQLKARGIQVGLATAANRANTKFTLEALQLHNYFDVVVTGDDIKEGKPNPAVYVETLRQLKMNAADALVFEDTLSGIKAAQAAGIRVVGLSTSHSPTELMTASPNFIIENYEGMDFEGLVQKLNL